MKLFLNFGSVNSPQHKAFLGYFNLNKRNAFRWLLKVLKDHCSEHILHYELTSQDDLRIAFLIPIDISTYSQNSFPTNIVAFKLVKEYPINPNTGLYQKAKGTAITGFLYDKPFKNDTIQMLQYPVIHSPNCPQLKYFGGQLATTNLYINTVGLPGINACLDVNVGISTPSFQLLFKAVPIY